VIALYLESFGNPRKFARIARRVGEHKPIVALKAGRTKAGARGASSHTAAAATSDIVVTALLERAGVIKVDRLEELIDVSGILLSSNIPEGKRIALVGNSGGPLILAADASESAGLEVAEFGPETEAALAGIAGPLGAVVNPVDLTADGSGEELERALTIAIADSAVDAAIVVVTPLPACSADAARAAGVAVSHPAAGVQRRRQRRWRPDPAPARERAALADTCPRSPRRRRTSRSGGSRCRR